MRGPSVFENLFFSAPRASERATKDSIGSASVFRKQPFWFFAVLLYTCTVYVYFSRVSEHAARAANAKSATHIARPLSQSSTPYGLRTQKIHEYLMFGNTF